MDPEDSAEDVLRNRVVAILKAERKLDSTRVEEAVPSGEVLIRWLVRELEKDILVLADDPEYNKQFCEDALRVHREEVAERWHNLGEHHRKGAPPRGEDGTHKGL